MDQAGYVRFRRWKIYGEQGRAGMTASGWVDATHLTIAYAAQPLATYEAKPTTDGPCFQRIDDPQIYPTQDQSSPIRLWERSNAAWLQAVRVYGYRLRRWVRLSLLQRELPLDAASQASEPATFPSTWTPVMAATGLLVLPSSW